MPTAAMSAQLNGLALFTVEQIELIRRLRNSGINKQQLVHAFDAMDQLDQELGPVYSLPITLQAIQQAALQRHNVFNTQQAVNVVAANNAAITAAMVAAAQQQQQQQQQQQVTGLNMSCADSPQPLTPGTRPMSRSPEPEPQNGGLGSGMVGTVSIKRPPPEIPTPLSPGQLMSISLPNLCNGLMEFPDDGINYYDEFRDFIRLGEQFCCEEIRNFSLKYSIKQQQIATLAGVSQSYVSRFLKGDVYEMSERSRRAIQKWYIMYRKNPAAIAPAVNAVLITNGSPPKKLSIETMATSNGDFVFQPKRERFVFRPNHLEILESYFQIDNYPSQEKRDEIAQACNNATISMAGRTLTEKETVTAQIIGNWFANKRKELKKIIKEGMDRSREGLDVSQVPLRPRGRPCRLLSDLITMVTTDQGSVHSETASTDTSMSPHCPGFPGRINGININPTDLSAPQNMVTDLSQSIGGSDGTTPENLAHVAVNNKPQQQQQQQQIAFEMATEQATGFELAAVQQHTKFDSDQQNSNFDMAQGIAKEQQPKPLSLKVERDEPMTGCEEDDHTLSMSVELAAVNQAILSLTGTQPINVQPTSAPAVSTQMIVKQSLPTTMARAGDGPSDT